MQTKKRKRKRILSTADPSLNRWRVEKKINERERARRREEGKKHGMVHNWETLTAIWKARAEPEKQTSSSTLNLSNWLVQRLQRNWNLSLEQIQPLTTLVHVLDQDVEALPMDGKYQEVKRTFHECLSWLAYLMVMSVTQEPWCTFLDKPNGERVDPCTVPVHFPNYTRNRLRVFLARGYYSCSPEALTGYLLSDTTLCSFSLECSYTPSYPEAREFIIKHGTFVSTHRWPSDLESRALSLREGIRECLEIGLGLPRVLVHLCMAYLSWSLASYVLPVE